MSRTRRIALALEVHHPFGWHQEIYSGVHGYARRQTNWRCHIDEFPCDTLPERLGDPLPYDGVIARVTEELAKRAQLLDLPLVNTWYSSPMRDALPGVFSDDAAAGRLCAEHLIERGFRHFGYLSDGIGEARQIAEAAFVEAVEEAGFICETAKFNPDAFEASSRWREFNAFLGAVADRLKPPVGVFVLEPVQARLLIDRCNERNWSVPEDVAIICESASEVLTQMPVPSITCVDGNYQQVGREAARLLDRLMSGEQPANTTIYIPPMGVVPRDSTDFFAVEDELVAEALRYISANLASPLDAQSIADAVHASSSTLRRRFKSQFGRPLAMEIRRLRIAMAKRQLAESNRSVKQVAAQCGFVDAKRLHEVFTREVGVSPSRWREQSR